MTIDDSGKKWWTGSEPSDIGEYLSALSAESYAIDEFRLAHCSCGCNRFSLKWLSADGAVQRICADCSTPHFICDSEENWEGKSRTYKCVGCHSPHANVGVGYSLYEGSTAVHWLFVGVRCSQCGILGCVADWKIGYEPSLQLLEQA